jgi:hypothetical protein
MVTAPPFRAFAPVVFLVLVMNGPLFVVIVSVRRIVAMPSAPLPVIILIIKPNPIIIARTKPNVLLDEVIFVIVNVGIVIPLRTHCFDGIDDRT